MSNRRCSSQVTGCGPDDDFVLSSWEKQGRKTCHGYIYDIDAPVGEYMVVYNHGVRGETYIMTRNGWKLCSEGTRSDPRRYNTLAVQANSKKINKPKPPPIVVPDKVPIKPIVIPMEEKVEPLEEVKTKPTVTLVENELLDWEEFADLEDQPKEDICVEENMESVKNTEKTENIKKTEKSNNHKKVRFSASVDEQQKMKNFKKSEKLVLCEMCALEIRGPTNVGDTKIPGVCVGSGSGGQLESVQAEDEPIDLQTKEHFRRKAVQKKKMDKTSRRKHWSVVAEKIGIKADKSLHANNADAVRFLCTRENAIDIANELKRLRMIRKGRLHVGSTKIKEVAAKAKLGIQSDFIATVGSIGHATIDSIRFAVSQAKSRMSPVEWRICNKIVDVAAAYRLLQSSSMWDKGLAIVMAVKSLVTEEYFLAKAEELVDFFTGLFDPKRYTAIPSIDPDTESPIPYQEPSDTQAGPARQLYDFLDNFDPNETWVAPPTLAASIDIFMALMHLGFVKEVDLGWMNELSCGLLREKIARTFSGKVESGLALFRAFKLFLEVAVIYEETGVFDPAGWGTLKGAQLFELYAKLIASRPDALDGNLTPGAAFSSTEEYNTLLEGAITSFKRKLAGCLKPAEKHMYASHLEKLLDIQEELRTQGRANLARVKPWTFLVCGVTSSMKSTVMQAVWRQAARANGISEDPNNCVASNMADEYHSEIRGQEVVLLDDFMNERKEGMAPGVNPIRKLLDWSGNNPVQLIGAAIQDKGRRYAKFKIMGLSAYDKAFKAHTLSYQPNAAFRRIDIYIEAHLKPEFRDADGQPDKSKLANKEVFPDLWEFDIYDYRIAGHDGGFQLKREKISNTELLEEVSRRSKLHFVFQKKIVETLNNPACWCCPHDNVPGACRQCQSEKTQTADELKNLRSQATTKKSEAIDAYADAVVQATERQMSTSSIILSNMETQQDLIADARDGLIDEACPPSEAVRSRADGGFAPLRFFKGWMDDRFNETVEAIATKAGAAVETKLTNAKITVAVSGLDTQAESVPAMTPESKLERLIRRETMLTPCMTMPFGLLTLGYIDSVYGQLNRTEFYPLSVGEGRYYPPQSITPFSLYCRDNADTITTDAFADEIESAEEMVNGGDPKLALKGERSIWQILFYIVQGGFALSLPYLPEQRLWVLRNFYSMFWLGMRQTTRMPPVAGAWLAASWLVPLRFWSPAAWKRNYAFMLTAWDTSQTRAQVVRAGAAIAHSMTDYASLLLRTNAIRTSDLGTRAVRWKLARVGAWRNFGQLCCVALAGVSDVTCVTATTAMAYGMGTWCMGRGLCNGICMNICTGRYFDISNVLAHMERGFFVGHAIYESYVVPGWIRGSIEYLSSKLSVTRSVDDEFRTYMKKRCPGMPATELDNIVLGHHPDAGAFANDFIAYRNRVSTMMLAFGGTAAVISAVVLCYKIWKEWTRKAAMGSEELRQVPEWFWNHQIPWVSENFAKSIEAVDEAIKKAPTPAKKTEIANWYHWMSSTSRHPLNWLGPKDDDRWEMYGIEYTQEQFDEEVRLIISKYAHMFPEPITVTPLETQASLVGIPPLLVGEKKTSFIAPSPSRISLEPAVLTMSIEDIKRAMRESIVWIEIDYEGRRSSCHAVAVGDHDFLIPTHVVVDNALIRGRTVDHLYKNSKSTLFGRAFSTRIDRKFTVDLPNDYSLVRLMSTPIFKDVSALFPLSPVEEPLAFGSLFYFDAVKHELCESEMCRIPHLSEEVDLLKRGQFYKSIRQYVFEGEYAYPIDTYVGLCASMWVGCSTKRGKPFIHSLHISGTAGTRLGGSTYVTSISLVKARADLAAGLFQPLNVQPTWAKEEDDIPIRHPINFVVENERVHTAVLMASHDLSPSRYRQEIQASKIEADLLEITGWEKAYKPVPHPNSSRHLNNALQEMTVLEDRFDNRYLQMAVEDLRDKYDVIVQRFDLFEQVCPLPWEAAISGVDGMVAVDALNPKTSMGYPLRGMKSKYLVPTEPMDRISEPKLFTPDIMAEIHDLEQKLMRGERGNFVFTSSVKIEPMKVTKDHARIFTCASAQMGVIFRKYYLPIFRIFHLAALDFGNTLGINVYSLDWDQLARSMRCHDRMIAGDYKNYDQFLPPRLIILASEVIIWIATLAGYSPEQITLMRTLAYEIAHPFVEAGGSLFQLFLHVSGHHGTLVFNNIMNQILWRYVYYTASPWCDLSEVPQERRASYMVDESVCGDDHILSVDQVIDFFDQVVMCDVLSAIGIVYTDDTKKAVSQRFTHLETLTYLSRYFRQHPELQRYVAPLKEKSLQKSYCMVDLSGELPEDVLLATNVANNDFELILHGRAYYERIGKMVRWACRKNGVQVPPLDDYAVKLSQFMRRHTLHSRGFSVQAGFENLDFAGVFDDRGVDWHLRNVFFIDTITHFHYYFVGIEVQRAFVPQCAIDALRDMISHQLGQGMVSSYRIDITGSERWDPVIVRGRNAFHVLPSSLADLIRRVFEEYEIPWRVWDYLPLLEAEVADPDVAYYWACAAWPFPCELDFAKQGVYTAEARDNWFRIHHPVRRLENRQTPRM